MDSNEKEAQWILIIRNSMNNSEKVARLLGIRKDAARLERMFTKNSRIVSFGFVFVLGVYVMVPGWVLVELNPYINETILGALFLLWMFGGGIFAAFYIVEMLAPEWYKNAKKSCKKLQRI